MCSRSEYQDKVARLADFLSPGESAHLREYFLSLADPHGRPAVRVPMEQVPSYSRVMKGRQNLPGVDYYDAAVTNTPTPYVFTGNTLNGFSNPARLVTQGICRPDPAYGIALTEPQNGTAIRLINHTHRNVNHYFDATATTSGVAGDTPIVGFSFLDDQSPYNGAGTAGVIQINATLAFAPKFNASSGTDERIVGRSALVVPVPLADGTFAYPLGLAFTQTETAGTGDAQPVLSLGTSIGLEVPALAPGSRFTIQLLEAGAGTWVTLENVLGSTTPPLDGAKELMYIPAGASQTGTVWRYYSAFRVTLNGWVGGSIPKININLIKPAAGGVVTTGNPASTIGFWPCSNTLFLQPIPSISNQIDTPMTRPSAMAVVVTFQGTDYANGGQGAIARLPAGIGLGGLDGESFYDKITKFSHDEYDGPAKDGLAGFWIPESIEEYEFRGYGQRKFSELSMLVFSYELTDNTQLRRILIDYSIEGLTLGLSHESEMAKPCRNFGVYLSKMREMTGQMTCNPEHKKLATRISKFLNGAMKFVLNPKNWEKGAQFAAALAPLLG